MTLRELADDLFVAEAPQRYQGIEVGARMTIMRLDGDSLLVHSPIGLAPSSVAHLGTLRWAIAPNLLHHLYIQPWIEAGAQGWCAPGLERKRPDLRFSGTLSETSSPFGDQVLVVPLRCFDFTNEVVVLHRPSRTLIVTDLLFNFPASAPWLTRVAMRCLGGYPGPRATLLERIGMKRDQARQDIGALLKLDFDRLIMAHGDVIETGGRQALASAFAWLGDLS